MKITDEPTWFGAPGNPLFGWLTRPTSTSILGGVVIVPSVGYEARNSKIALRNLAWSLARSGFVTLRFNFRGTGDSSGDFGESLPNPDWIDDTVSAIGFIQSAGLQQVSLVGFRIGATLAAAALSDPSVNVTSLVLWDPCDSGWSYLRELRALESLRRSHFADSDDGSVETTEFLFSKEMVTALRSLKMTTLLKDQSVEHILVVTRTLRPLPSKLRDQLQMMGATFSTTDEQELLLDVEPFDAAAPFATIASIESWFSQLATNSVEHVSFAPIVETLTTAENDETSIRERATFLGEKGLFAMLCEPVHSHVGPWIVMIGNVHDDHTGPSRIWVELSRRWARSGLRCARVDLSGMGESNRPDQAPFVEHLDSRWVKDVITLAHSLDSKDPSNIVFIGFCASATLAMEGALALNAKGICLVNPALGRNLSHTIYRLQQAPSQIPRFFAKKLKRLLLSHPWIATTMWETARHGFPGKWSRDILHDIQKGGSDILFVSNADDLSKFSNVPIVRSIEGRRVHTNRNYMFQIVPDLDHAMNVASGRIKTVALLEDYVQSTFATEAERKLSTPFLEQGFEDDSVH